MGKPKSNKNKNKNNPDERKTVKKVIIKTSFDCEKCKNKCQKGIDYINNMVPGKAYKGIACVK